MPAISTSDGKSKWPTIGPNEKKENSYWDGHDRQGSQGGSLKCWGDRSRFVTTRVRGGRRRAGQEKSHSRMRGDRDGRRSYCPNSRENELSVMDTKSPQMLEKRASICTLLSALGKENQQPYGNARLRTRHLRGWGEGDGELKRQMGGGGRGRILNRRQDTVTS